MPYIGKLHKHDFKIFQYGIPLAEDKYTFDGCKICTLEPDIIIYIDKSCDVQFFLGNRAVLINNNNYADIAVCCLDNCHIIGNSYYILSCGDNCIVTIPCLGKSIFLDNQIIELEEGVVTPVDMKDSDYFPEFVWQSESDTYKGIIPDPFKKRIENTYPVSRKAPSL